MRLITATLWKSLMRAHPGDYEWLESELRVVVRERFYESRIENG